MFDRAHARKKISAIAEYLANKHRSELETLKDAHRILDRPDFLWYCLLQSFATMGRSKGWDGLIDNQSIYNQVAFRELQRLSPIQRNERLHTILSAAKVRWAKRKVGYILQCFEQIEAMGGLESAQEKLLSESGRENKIAFLDGFTGIGDKYARNIMMDVYHEDFKEAIAIDSRINKISSALGQSFDTYQEHEQFYLDAAHDAKLEGWELDRLMYNFRDEFLEMLLESHVPAGVHPSGNAEYQTLDVRMPQTRKQSMIVDFDLDFLDEAAALIDMRLERLENEAQANWDPDQFGIFDQTEYITGLGFVACQTYATAVVKRSGLKKREALTLGPKHRTGRSVIELINAAANYWKHSSEWSLDAPTTQAKQTLEAIQSLGVDTKGSYPVANTLHEILTPLPVRFANLIPLLTQWRDALPK